MFDIYDDEHGFLLKVIEREYDTKRIKTASLTEEPRAFAWSEEKKFPIDTIPDIQMSYLYFQKTASDISPGIRELVERKIKTAAQFNNINLDDLHKERVLVAQIRPEEFAVSIPLNQLPPEMKSKVKTANYIYNNNFSIYPLNNHENVKTANYMFPEGLEDFPQLQPVVAQRIAEKLDPSALTAKVKAQMPFSKMAMIEELDARDSLSSGKVNVLSKIKTAFTNLPDTKDNRYQMYKIMKSASAVLLEDSKMNYSKPEKFLQGWVEDIPVSTDFIINNHRYNQKAFMKSASALREYYPEVYSLTRDPHKLKEYLESLENDDLDVIENILRAG